GDVLLYVHSFPTRRCAASSSAARRVRSAACDCRSPAGDCSGASICPPHVGSITRYSRAGHGTAIPPEHHPGSHIFPLLFCVGFCGSVLGTTATPPVRAPPVRALPWGSVPSPVPPRR